MVRGEDHDFDDYDLPLGVDPDKPWHEFLSSRRQRQGRADLNILELIGKVREGIGELRDATATFRLSEMVDEDFSSSFPDEAALLAGTWPVPDRFAAGENKIRRFVNPNYTHARYYAAVSVECRCGARKLRSNFGPTDDYPLGEDEHYDHCLRQWRLRTRANLLDKRRDKALKVLRLGLSIRQMQDMLGLASDSLGPSAYKIGVHIENEKERAREIRARTCARLLRYRSTNEIANAYGIAPGTVRNTVNRYTDVTTKEIKEEVREK